MLTSSRPVTTLPGTPHIPGLYTTRTFAPHAIILVLKGNFLTPTEYRQRVPCAQLAKLDSRVFLAYSVAGRYFMPGEETAHLTKELQHSSEPTAYFEEISGSNTEVNVRAYRQLQAGVEVTMNLGSEIELGLQATGHIPGSQLLSIHKRPWGLLHTGLLYQYHSQFEADTTKLSNQVMALGTERAVRIVFRLRQAGCDYMRGEISSGMKTDMVFEIGYQMRMAEKLLTECAGKKDAESLLLTQVAQYMLFVTNFRLCLFIASSAPHILLVNSPAYYEERMNYKSMCGDTISHLALCQSLLGPTYYIHSSSFTLLGTLIKQAKIYPMQPSELLWGAERLISEIEANSQSSTTPLLLNNMRMHAKYLLENQCEAAVQANLPWAVAHYKLLALRLAASSLTTYPSKP